MKYKAIIFDMDGTIIDSEHIWQKANKALLENRDIEYTEELAQELHKRISGIGLPESCQIIKDILKLDDHVDELVAEKGKTASELLTQQICFIKGFVEFHKKTQHHNLKTALATNADDHTLFIAHTELQLHEFFGKHMYNVSHVQNRAKPDPALYEHAALQLEIDPVECIAIEDSWHGIAAAKGAQMYCIGINTAQQPHLLHKADTIIDEYHEIDLEQLLEIT